MGWRRDVQPDCSIECGNNLEPEYSSTRSNYSIDKEEIFVSQRVFRWHTDKCSGDRRIMVEVVIL
jgi:hypothetical protein